MNTAWSRAGRTMAGAILLGAVLGISTSPGAVPGMGAIHDGVGSSPGVVAGAASTDAAVLAYRGRYQIRLSEAAKLLTPTR